MPTAQEFINNARASGYSDADIAQFLTKTETLDKKQRQALDLLSNTTRELDPDMQRLVNEAARSTNLKGETGDRVRSALKSAATIGGTALAAYAAGGPIASAISGLGQAAQEIGGDEPPQPEGGPQPEPQPGGAPGGQDEGGLIQDLLGKAGQAIGTPSMRDLVTLYNTYRRRGGAHTLAQFASNVMKNMARQEGQGGQAQAGVELPEPLQQEALKAFEITGNPSEASMLAAQNVLFPKHPLNNLAKTIQKRAGRDLTELFSEFLSTVAQGAQQPQQDPQGQQVPGGMDFANLSDQQLFQLMQRRNLL
jgi:hypothetical protein